MTGALRLLSLLLVLVACAHQVAAVDGDAAKSDQLAGLAVARAAELEGALVSGCADTVRSAVSAYARAWTVERRADSAR